MEQDRKPRNKPMNLWSINLWQRRQDYTLFTTEWRHFSSTNVAGKTKELHAKKFKLVHSLTSYMKIISKWIKILNVRLDTMKLIEENIGRTISDIKHSNIFFDPSPRIMEIKAKINKQDLLKLKIFCIAKKINRQPTD